MRGIKVQRMNDDRAIPKSVPYAAVAACLLMLAFGLTYRVVAARLAGPTDKAPIDPAVVASFPMQIGDWMGQEVPMDEDVVRATDTDAHISRRYSHANGVEGVSLYVACGVRARDLMPHRPEVCYTGAGWTVVEHITVELHLADGIALPCSRYLFSRGALSTEKVLVLYYYIVDGQYCGDVSLLRSQAWRGSGTVDYVAQVQVVTPVLPLSRDRAEGLVESFAKESAPLIAQLFKKQTTAENIEGSDSPLKKE